MINEFGDRRQRNIIRPVTVYRGPWPPCRETGKRRPNVKNKDENVSTWDREWDWECQEQGWECETENEKTENEDGTENEMVINVI